MIITKLVGCSLAGTHLLQKFGLGNPEPAFCTPSSYSLFHPHPSVGVPPRLSFILFASADERDGTEPNLVSSYLLVQRKKEVVL